MKLNFLQFVQREKHVFIDGAMATYLNQKGVPLGSCFEELNLENPQVVREVHQEYMKAGAEVIMANTFGASLFKLRRFGLEGKMGDILRKGIQILLSVTANRVYAAGTLGPLGVLLEPYGELSFKEAEKYFAHQAGIMVEEGVDLIIVETFASPYEAVAAVRGVRSVSDIPLVVSFAVNEYGKTRLQFPLEKCFKALPRDLVDIVGINCVVGPYAMLGLVERFRTSVDCPFIVMPNAGRLRDIGDQAFYVSSPDDFRRAAPHLIDYGVNLIGGCCGTTPEHIRAMIEGAKAHRARKKWISVVSERQKFKDERKKQVVNEVRLSKKVKFHSELAKSLQKGEFICLAELVPERGAGYRKALAKARDLAELGVNGINIPDGPRATARMSPMALSVLVQKEVGVEVVLHYACRDRNILGIQADLLGAWALGVKNLLVITGDPPVVGDLPRATGVFDVDAIGLVNLVTGLNQGHDVGGNPLDEETGFLTGVGINPFSSNIDRELSRFKWKVLAGANFAITQPVFDVDRFKRFFEKALSFKIPLVAGVWPLISLRNAEFISAEIPGIFVPTEILEKMGRFEKKVDQLKVGIDITLSILRRLKEISELAGVQFSIPFGRHKVLEDLIPEARR